MYFYNVGELVSIPTLANNLWDRTGVVTPNTQTVALTPISAATNAKAFACICQERAEELANLVKGTDKKLFLFWSGGLDSTAAFLLLRAAMPKGKLAVVYTEHSELEYPGFLDSNIRGAHETIVLDRFASWRTVKECCEKGVVVTGEIGDQIFGGSHCLRLSQEELQKHWTTYNPLFTKSKLINSAVENCPRRINNVAEMLWWLNYTLKYQYVQIKLLLDNEVSILNKNLVHFFDSAGFNDYAVCADVTDKMPRFEIKKYKLPLREVIAELSKDNVYAFNKPKIPSLWKDYGRFSRSLVAKTVATDWVRGY
jgi:hypothetical protein